MVCTFQKSCDLLKLSKMLMGNIYNWLQQGNGAIVLAYSKILQDESDRGFKAVLENSLNPWIIYEELLVWQETAL